MPTGDPAEAVCICTAAGTGITTEIGITIEIGITATADPEYAFMYLESAASIWATK